MTEAIPPDERSRGALPGSSDVMAGEDDRPGDRQRPEAVDDAGREVLAEPGSAVMPSVTVPTGRRRHRRMGSRAKARFRSLTRPLLRWVHNGGLSTLILLMPLLLAFGYFAWYPIGRAVVMSFQKTNLVAEPVWVGLDNFDFVLGDPRFWTSVRNTVFFTLLGLLIGYPVPLALALVMSELRRARGLFSMLAYLPVVIPPVVAVLLWRFFYDASETGVFNTMLGWIGLGPYDWIQSKSSAMPSLVLQATWANAGSTVIIYLAALSGLASDLYDAAEVDGAGLWRKIWHITLPQMRNILLITLIVQVIATFQVFTEPFLMTGGGPQNSTTTVLLQIYDYAFRFGNYGAATALSVILALFLGVLSALYFRVTRSWSTT